jgi:hypothetical protein
MLYDEEGNLWSGTWFAGMNRFNIEENKRDFEPLKEIAEKPNYKKGYH